MLTTAEREELSRLRKEVRELRMEREILKKSRGLLREGEQVKFALVDAEKANYPISKLCSVLGVSRAGYYAWCVRPESKHTREDRRLAMFVREAHERSRRTYGSPRVNAEFAAQEIFVSRKLVHRLMDEHGLKLSPSRSGQWPARRPRDKS